MIKSVTVINGNNDELKMDLSHPEISGLNITDITGLGPGDAEINGVVNVGSDGSMFNSAHIGTREIVISMKYWRTPSVEVNRHKTYKLFPLKELVTLVFETTKRTLLIQGYVKRNEATIFSKESGCQITIDCLDPFFQALGGDFAQKIDLSKVSNNFEFVWSNESITSPLTEFSTILSDQDVHVLYDGDVESGLYINIHINGDFGDITLFDTKHGKNFKINRSSIESKIGKKPGAGDDIIISMIPRNNYVAYRSGDQTWNILNAVDKNAYWFKIQPGDNAFSYVASSGTENLSPVIYNRVLYYGV